MCGRFALFSKDKIKHKFNIDIKPNFNISPNQMVITINEKRQIVKLKWGIKPEWHKSMLINARNETLEEKKTFKNTKRCIFIADGYFEWKKEKGKKVPFYHFLDNKLLFFAGIYDDTGCCVVTRESFVYLTSIHTRQPFFLKENQINYWLDRNDVNYVFDNIINFYRVSDSVNKIWNNSPHLIMEKN